MANTEELQKQMVEQLLTVQVEIQHQGNAQEIDQDILENLLQEIGQHLLVTNLLLRSMVPGDHSEVFKSYFESTISLLKRRRKLIKRQMSLRNPPAISS